MTKAADVIRDRVEQLGWQVTHVIDPALVIEGRDVGVVHVKAIRGPLRTLLVVLLTAEDARRAGPYMPFGPSSPAVASAKLPDTGWEVHARVHDLESARVEMEHLRASFPRADNDAFERTLSLFEQRGWQIDRERSRATLLDEPSWALFAARDGDVLDVNFSFPASQGSDRVTVSDLDFVTLVSEHVTAFATVSSRRRAEHLVSELLRPSRGV